MQSSIFTELLLPALLAFIMFGMGLSLKPEDFSRLFKAPKAVALGLIGQMLLLPLMAFCLAIYLDASPETAIGMMILAACPGGTSSNLFSHIAKANLALSVSLTAITTVICVVSTPWLIKFAIEYFSQGEPIQFSLLSTSLSLIMISLVPVSVGMLVRNKKPKFAAMAEPKFRVFSLVFMVVIIGLVAWKERAVIQLAFPDIFFYALILNLSATLLGVIIAKLGKLNSKDGITLGIEIGTQNGTMAILIALSFIQEPAYSVAPAVYGILMYIGAISLVLYSKKFAIEKA